MLETGNWMVPTLNGSPYLRKPPLVNWLIALSMKATGRVDEWAARLPSVLATLALALTVAWTAWRWLPSGGALVAALFVLTGVGLGEKARLAEIEAVYVGLTGMAFAWWMAAWARRETGWKLWLVPAICLGFGLLAKGPLHLLLFYAVIIPVLIVAGEKRQLWSVAHLGSLVLVVSIFCAWAVPYLRQTAHLNAQAVWLDQMRERVGGGNGHLSSLISNGTHALCNGLPWILFAPLWWNARVLGAIDDRKRLLVQVARWPLAIGFLGLMVIPGMQPRYTLPLYPAAALLLALAALHAPAPARNLWHGLNRVLIVCVGIASLAAGWIAKPAALSGSALVASGCVTLGVLAAGLWVFRQGAQNVPRLATSTALAVAGLLAVYSVAIVPRRALHAETRGMGEAINQAVPEGDTLYVCNPGFEPAFFYVRRPCVFVPKMKDLPAAAVYCLLREEDARKLAQRPPDTRELAQLRAANRKQLVLWKLPSPINVQHP